MVNFEIGRYLNLGTGWGGGGGVPLSLVRFKKTTMSHVLVARNMALSPVGY